MKAITIKRILKSDSFGFENGSETGNQIRLARQGQVPSSLHLWCATIIAIISLIIVIANCLVLKGIKESISEDQDRSALNTYILDDLSRSQDILFQSTIADLENELAEMSLELETLKEENNRRTLSRIVPDETIKLEESVPLTDSTYVSEDEMSEENVSSQDIVSAGDTTLVECALPSDYYGDIDFSSFQPYMDYRLVTLEGTGSYRICHSPDAYTDRNGLRRYRTTSDQYTVNGQDDYVIALGTFYKEKGSAGDRYLIVTSTGSYTAIAGDEKGDADTDPLHMFGMCGGNPNVIEFIVDQSKLVDDIAIHGTVTKGPVDELTGEILKIYKIQ